jgi:hypothetical protein
VDGKTESEAMTFEVTGVKHGAVTGRVKGDGKGQDVTGPFEAEATEGSCAAGSDPVTRAHVTIFLR